MSGVKPILPFAHPQADTSRSSCSFIVDWLLNSETDSQARDPNDDAPASSAAAKRKGESAG